MGLSKKELNLIRGNEISMIFQETMTSLSPILYCGFQVAEQLMLHKGFSKKEAFEVKALVKEARNIGIDKIIASHGVWKMMGHTKDELKEYVDLGAFVEFVFYLCQGMVQYIHGHPPVSEIEMLETMKYIGFDHCIVSTNMG